MAHIQDFQILVEMKTMKKQLTHHRSVHNRQRVKFQTRILPVSRKMRRLSFNHPKPLKKKNKKREAERN